MPLSFFRDFDTAKGISLNANEKRLLEYIKNKEKEYDSEDSIEDYNLTLKIDVKFQKVKSNVTGIPFQLTNDPTAPSVRLSEEDITDKFPWDYNVLSTRLRKRYSDFVTNKKYHDLRKKFEKDKKLVYTRFLNPKNKNGGHKTFYNPNIQKEFDKHYTKV